MGTGPELIAFFAIPLSPGKAGNLVSVRSRISCGLVAEHDESRTAGEIHG